MSSRARFQERAVAWGVDVERTLETESSLIGFGRRESLAVVMKVLKRLGDEWTSGSVVQAFHGRGVVRVHAHVDGALLLERLTPGHSLVSTVLEDRDVDATDVVADVMQQMSGATPPPGCVAVGDWGKAFERYDASGDSSIPPHLVEEGRHWFDTLESSQQDPRLLHGDLHHSNILFDAQRGWVAIDPKGVVGEVEYEIGAALRNPIEYPDLFTAATIVERRVTQFARRLDVRVERVLAWSFAQAVLSAIWAIEDGAVVGPTTPFIRLANVLRGMLPASP